MASKNTCILLLCTVCIISRGFGTTWYVSSDGVDTGTRNGRSHRQAWASVGYACRQISGVHDTIRVGRGTFEQNSPVQPKGGLTMIGAGRCATIIKGADAWAPGTDDLPDNAVDHTSVNRSAYLFDLGDKTRGVTIADMTLTGSQLHGAIYGNDCDSLHVYGCLIEDFLWSSIRTFRMGDARIHDNVFVDAGGKYRHDGGALYLTWVADSRFWNNHIFKTAGHHSNFYGFKGRQARRCRFHHNTVEVGFSFEFPFENDEMVEIDHNFFKGPTSIPKQKGGPVLDSGYSFYFHHNLVTRSYALEWPRNHAEIAYNYFLFNTDDDKGNLISGFDSKSAPGPLQFHHNQVRNPGRGIIWLRGGTAQAQIYNNHIVAHPTITPREIGLFGFNPGSDFSTIAMRNNIIECVDLARPLMRNEESYGATIENNRFINISDTASFSNPSTSEAIGLEQPLQFTCGAYNHLSVNGWDTASLKSLAACTTDGAPSAVSFRAAELNKPFARYDRQNERVTIHLPPAVLRTPKQIRVQLFDISGRLIYEEIIRRTGTAVHTVDLSPYAGGVYTITCAGESLPIVKKK